MTTFTYDNNAASRAAKAREKLMLPSFRRARETSPDQNLATCEIFDLMGEGFISMRAFQLYVTFLKLVDAGTLQVSAPRKDLAKKLGLLHTASVDRYIRELEYVGLLRVEYQFGKYGTGHKANLYTIGLAPCPGRDWAA
ncbi:hypothetical protein FEZ60_30890 [Rhodococcus sp. MS16]|uniref:hypothetical protein n=1 Tax=Rhodococcus sp. MS16 TaxID=2579941 RepID=UPI001561EF77|nr:hypothetical protein [Rhodococcus sp. MS16]NRI69917.1 hypothetical protein [Rhodococcus sp. MS16]